MHDISLFLLKNWLPVGVSAIVFFCIGLLLARMTWGRYSQRLSYAVEENMNLASQWSALGSSQKDLFKKLRVRWQADRDSWERSLAEKEKRIETLTLTLTSSGKEIPAEVVADQGLREKIRELEAQLDRERAEYRQWRDEASGVPVVSPVATAMAAAAPVESAEAVAASEFQARIRDLEQDLIDTHDELHDVRAEYQKQLALVEALEAKLIGNPLGKVPGEPALAVQRIATLEAKLAAAEAASVGQAAEVAQWRALLPQRAREICEIRRRSGSLIESSGESNARLLRDLEELSAVVAGRGEEITALETALRVKSDALEAAEGKVVEFELLQRRKVSLQAELNDAYHEMYDVRRALNLRLAEITTLEERLSGLDLVEARNEELAGQLESAREELAGLLQHGSMNEDRLTALTEEVADLRARLIDRNLERESLQNELTRTRHELSDARLAYTVSAEDYQKALAQMEELEAIIEDRSTEVNDLATELRTQRDLVRQLKNTLAEAEGELEALNDESRRLNAEVTARTAFVEEQRRRIVDLELALSERYDELNAVRVDVDESSKHARYHEARSRQLEAELDRRRDEFAASDERVASAEEAVDAAQVRVAALSAQLEQSANSLVQLQEELSLVSRDKDDTIRELDHAILRIGKLEEAATLREAQLEAISEELSDSSRRAEDLDIRLNRLNTELEAAREEQEVSRLAVVGLEEALRSSDERAIQLSSRLEEKEAEVSALLAELEGLRVSIKTREADEAEASTRLEAMQAEYEARLGELEAAIAAAGDERDLITKQQGEEKSRITAEVEALRETIAEQLARLEVETEGRSQSLAEVEALREKLEQRSESIRELQDQLSGIMLQRAARDNEISLLKEKLLVVGIELSAARQAGAPDPFTSFTSQEVAEPLVDEVSLAAAIHRSLTAEVSGEEEGIALEELLHKTTHHTPRKDAEPAPTALTSGGKKSVAGSDDDHTVYFNEGTATLSSTELEKIDLCARVIRRFGRKVEVTVIGYAGSEGNPDRNERLSAARADAVRERLLERGVSQNSRHGARCRTGPSFL